MSITINGSTNILTASSGLTVSGNMAVTGSISSTGNNTLGDTALTDTTTLPDETALAVTTNTLPTMRPSLLLDFANSQTLDPRITFTRASAGTYFDAKGVLRTAAAGVPRFDHDPVTGICKGLLIEESRTNLLTYSEQFDNAAWTKTRSSISANATTAPDGTTTADKLVEDATATNSHLAVQAVTTTASSTTLSVFAKAGERSWVRLVLFDGATSFAAYFNLATGTIGTLTGAVTAQVKELPNGWWRLSITATTASGSGNAAFRIATADNTDSYTGDGASGIYIWGASFGVGAFSTSYMQTTTASVTRSADMASMTGTNFSDWYRQDEGTIIAKSLLTWDIPTDATKLPHAWRVSDGTNNNFILQGSGNTVGVYSIKAGSVDQVADNPTESENIEKTTAFAYKTNDVAHTLNGGGLMQDTTVTLPVVTQLNLGGRYDNAPALTLNGCIAFLVYYPLRLPNATLQGISSL